MSIDKNIDSELTEDVEIIAETAKYEEAIFGALDALLAPFEMTIVKMDKGTDFKHCATCRAFHMIHATIGREDADAKNS